jgi:hypothetical protein
MAEEPRWMGGPKSGLNPFEAENRRLRANAEQLRKALEEIAASDSKCSCTHIARTALDREGVTNDPLKDSS